MQLNFRRLLSSAPSDLSQAQEHLVAVEEIKEAKNPVEKEMLLQKYGMIEPKLTQGEVIAIKRRSAETSSNR